MSDFDDSELRRQLRRLAGPEPDDGAALVAVRQRAGAIRRRRTVAWTAGSVVAVAALALLAIRPGSSTPEHPAVSGVVSTVGTTPPPSSPPMVPGTSTTTTVGSTTSVTGSTVPGSNPDTSMSPTTSGSVAPAVTSVPAEAPTSTPSAPTAPPEVGPSTTPATPPVATDPPTLPPAPTTTEPATSAPTTVPSTAAPVTSTYSGQGGSATVRLTGGQLSLVSQTPNAGFTSEIHDNGPDRVEVRFRSSNHETVVRVDLVGGQMVPRVDENGA